MDLRRIPPSVQRRWADEVLYLHSLWHQSPTPLSNPNSSPNSKKRTRSDKEWPTPAPTPAAPAPLTAWPDPVRPPHPRPPPSTTARALHVQYPALQSTRDYFSSQESDDEDEEEEDDEEAKAYEFFLGVFVGDGELRGYYEKSHEKGEFLCLVCGGVGAKVGRKYAGCVALVQHACSIAKWRKRGKVHRGFGRVVCRVLGWDATRLPSIVLDGEKPLGQTIVNEMQMQDGLQKEGDVQRIVEIPNDAGQKDEPEGDMLDLSAVKEIVEEGLQNEGDVQRIVEIPNDAGQKDEPEGNMMDLSAVKEIVEDGLQKEGDVQRIVEIPNHAGQKDEPEGNMMELSTVKEIVEEGGVNDVKEVLEGSKKKIRQILGSPGLISGQTSTLPKVLSTSEKQARSNSSRVQRNGLKATKAFLAPPYDEEEDEEDDDEKVKRQSIALKFFLGLLEIDKDLKNHYEKNSLKGDYICLVCAGIGIKRWQRFADCIGLVQHSKTIVHKKKTWAHRAFAEAICQVLCWDTNGNTSIVVPPKDSLNQSLAIPAKTQDETR